MGEKSPECSRGAKIVSTRPICRPGLVAAGLGRREGTGLMLLVVALVMPQSRYSVRLRCELAAGSRGAVEAGSFAGAALPGLQSWLFSVRR